MKMYILVRDSIPLGFSLVAVAHASLAVYLRFHDSPEVQEWLKGPFKKTICKVSDAEFELARNVEDHVLITESALDHMEVAIGFCPRVSWPKSFRYFPLYR